ncbi:hypothetical protein PMG71_13720 [Roseofilum sp. BLCC_M154]|uniref:Uncharacterized protein n=1 Tax=Roseofilum acuticapitatum BLCC-M154 TaxID=3022444 RepID=A0ABT7AUA3_9CYAN|nr:hypothetical protein [Roseofilum acuticapitatum]MDJ1170488.1 hypothetical protein [Roseofilum acuticapitatum BLCC-M154]
MLAQFLKWELQLPFQRQKTAIAPPPTASSISPWLTPFVYPFARHLLLPSYFGSLEVKGREHFPTDGSPVIRKMGRNPVLLGRLYRECSRM